VSFIYFLLTANNVFAERNIINSSGLADKHDFEGNEELSMIGEFGFLSADVSTLIITAKINTSQESSIRNVFNNKITGFFSFETKFFH
jgi:hypothetical protein